MRDLRVSLDEVTSVPDYAVAAGPQGARRNWSATPARSTSNHDPVEATMTVSVRVTMRCDLGRTVSRMSDPHAVIGHSWPSAPEVF